MVRQLRKYIPLLALLIGCASIYPSMIGTPGVTHPPGTLSMGLDLEFPAVMRCEPIEYQGDQVPCNFLPAVPVFPMLGLDFSIGLPLDMQLNMAMGMSIASIVPNLRLKVLKMFTNSLSGGLEVSGSPKGRDKIIADYISYKALLLYAYPSIYRETGAYFGIAPQLAYFMQAPSKPIFITTLAIGWYMDTPTVRLRIESGIDFQLVKREDDDSTAPIGFYAGISLGFYLYGLPKSKEAKVFKN